MVRAWKTMSWANMKEQRSEAPLLFHASARKKRREPRDIPMSCTRSLLNPSALRLLGFNKFAQLVVFQALSETTFPEVTSADTPMRK